MGLKIYRAIDERLIRDCCCNDRHAQRFLYDRLAGKMFAVCCRYIKSRMEAEDVLVVAFAKVFEKIGQYKSEGSFEGWVRRIVVNECLTHLRKSRSMHIVTDITAAEYEPNYEALEDQFQAEDLLNMIARLAPGYRIVFNLYALDGYSHKEIAEQLGISENTSKSQLSRARAYLQKALEVAEKKSEKWEGYESYGSVI